MQRADQVLDPVLGQQAREELDDELLDTRRRHLPIDGLRSRTATGSRRMLDIPAVDGHLDGQAPAPPAHPAITSRRKRPGQAVRGGGTQDREHPLQRPDIPAGEASSVLGGGIEESAG